MLIHCFIEIFEHLLNVSNCDKNWRTKQGASCSQGISTNAVKNRLAYKTIEMSRGLKVNIIEQRGFYCV